MRLRLISALGTALAVLAAGCNKGEPPIEAGGSTFAYPMMSKWAGEYEKARRGQLAYLSIGSGGGVQGMIDKTLDFGCTDGPMSEEDLKQARAAGGEVIHVPLLMGAVGPVYNLDEVEQPLRFTG